MDIPGMHKLVQVCICMFRIVQAYVCKSVEERERERSEKEFEKLDRYVQISICVCVCA